MQGLSVYLCTWRFHLVTGGVWISPNSKFQWRYTGTIEWNVLERSELKHVINFFPNLFFVWLLCLAMLFPSQENKITQCLSQVVRCLPKRIILTADFILFENNVLLIRFSHTAGRHDGYMIAVVKSSAQQKFLSPSSIAEIFGSYISACYEWIYNHIAFIKDNNYLIIKPL